MQSHSTSSFLRFNCWGFVERPHFDALESLTWITKIASFLLYHVDIPWYPMISHDISWYILDPLKNPCKWALNRSVFCWWCWSLLLVIFVIYHSLFVFRDVPKKRFEDVWHIFNKSWPLVCSEPPHFFLKVTKEAVFVQVLALSLDRYHLVHAHQQHRTPDRHRSHRGHRDGDRRGESGGMGVAGALVNVGWLLGKTGVQIVCQVFFLDIILDCKFQAFLGSTLR